MAWFQQSIQLQPRRRGFHPATAGILPQIERELRTRNENADPAGRVEGE